MTEFFQALQQRHLAHLTRQEFTRAVRALSARYVEQRGQLPDRSPLDSAGKRAAFGLFYAAQHFLAVSAAVAHADLGRRPLTRLVDLGCGTGVCSAAWALACPPPPPEITGIDLNAWALDEARWNWRTLGLHGRSTKGDAAEALARLVARPQSLAGTGIVAGWAINEMPAATQARLLEALATSAERGASVLILEPLARRVSPWWDAWVGRLSPLGADTADLQLADRAPEWLDDLARSAGLSALSGARVLWIRPTL